MRISLKKKLEGAILSAITENLCLIWNDVAYIGDRNDARLVQWLLENDYIPEWKIRQAVHSAVCATGKAIFERHCEAPNSGYPDDCLQSPSALGYAIWKGVVTPEEATLIKFDHGETVDDYIAMAENLIDKVMDQLKAGPSLQVTNI